MPWSRPFVVVAWVGRLCLLRRGFAPPPDVGAPRRTFTLRRWTEQPTRRRPESAGRPAGVRDPAGRDAGRSGTLRPGPEEPRLVGGPCRRGRRRRTGGIRP